MPTILETNQQALRKINVAIHRHDRLVQAYFHGFDLGAGLPPVIPTPDQKNELRILANQVIAIIRTETTKLEDYPER